MRGLRTTFSRVAAGAALTMLLTGYARAQTPLERIAAMPRATDSDIAAMLTTRNDQAVNRTLALSYRDVITVFAQRAGPMPEKSSEFRFIEPRKGALPKIKKQAYPQYGNPTGVLQPTNLLELGDEESADGMSGRFYITSFAKRAIAGYEQEMSRLRDVAAAQGIPVHEYLEQFRIDTPIPTIDGKTIPGSRVAAIRTYLRMGAIKEGMAIDLRPVNGRRVANIAFTFQPDGKQPLACVSRLPYDLAGGEKVFRPQEATLVCAFEGTNRWILTPWLEDRIKSAAYAASTRNVGGGGGCGADCRSPGSWDAPPVMGAPVDIGGGMPFNDPGVGFSRDR